MSVSFRDIVAVDQHCLRRGDDGIVFSRW